MRGRGGCLLQPKNLLHAHFFFFFFTPTPVKNHSVFRAWLPHRRRLPPPSFSRRRCRVEISCSYLFLILLPPPLFELVEPQNAKVDAGREGGRRDIFTLAFGDLQQWGEGGGVNK